MAITKTIRGTIVESENGAAGSGLIVKLGTMSGRSVSSISETTTDQAGRFCFDVTALASQSGGGSRFRLDVYAGATALQTHGDVDVSTTVDTESLVLAVTHPTPVVEVSDDPPEGLPGFSDEALHGVVRHSDGSGLEGLVVKLFRRAWSDLGSTTSPLDTTTTLEGGWYSFEALAETGSPLYVEVWKPVLEGQTPPTLPIGRSRVTWGYAGGSRRIDVVLHERTTRRDSEFKRLSVALSQAIFPGLGAHPAPGLGDALATLDPERAAWLEGQTGWSMERITERALAERLSASLSDEPSPLAPEALYGLLRQGMTAGANSLFGQAPSRIQRALAVATANNEVSADLSVEQTLVALRAASLKRQTGTGEDSLGAILRCSAELGQAAGLSTAQVTALCALQAGFEGTDQAFWSAAQALSPFSGQAQDPAIAEAKRLIRLGSVALGHAPTLKAILASLETQTAEETAGWDATRWTTVAETVDPLPSELPGDNDIERRESLAILLKEHAELCFPAAAIRAGLLQVGSQFGLSAWIGLNSEIDLRSCRLTAEDPPEAFLAQRLCRVAPSLNTVAAMEKLSQLNLFSARDIARAGRTRFLETWAPESDTAGRAEGLEVFRKAQSQAGLAAGFFLQAHPALGRAPAGFLPPAELNVLELPFNWSSFFGKGAAGTSVYMEPPGTRGDWCDSIHGPSAYLVDLLDWLSDRSAPWSVSLTRESALTVLGSRRPDITRLPLTCPNATRSLPYVDLVLEILEEVVVNDDLVDMEPRSSEVGTEEMLASPQYTNEDAYGSEKLGNATHTFLTPFHQPLHEARAFLAHLGIDRADLMRLRRDMPVSDLHVPTELDIAIEELGLSKESADAITFEGESEADYWSLPTLTSPPTLRELRRAAGLGYTELLDLIHTREVNDLGPLMLGMGRESDAFDESSYALMSNMDGACPSTEHFCAMRRMLRLRRVTGWTLLETDKVLHALESRDLIAWGDDWLRELGEIHRLVKMTGEEPTAIVAWFADIDTFMDRETADVPVQSLYDRVFLNPAIFPTFESTEESFPLQLDQDREELLATIPETTTLAALGRLRSVLGQEQAELGELLYYLHGSSWGDQVLSLSLLSELYRWCSLARVLDLKPTEAWRLARCMGRESVVSSVDTWVFASPSSAIDFLEIAARLRDAGAGVDELEYLLMHESVERVAPTEEHIQGILGRLRDAVAVQDNEASEEARMEALRDQLASELGISRLFAGDLDHRMWVGAAVEEQEEDLPCFLVSALRYKLSEGFLDLESDLEITLTEAADVVMNAGNETLPAGTTVVVKLGSAVEAIILSAGTRCAFTSEDEITIDEELPVGTRFEFAAGVSVTVGISTLALATTATGSISSSMELELGAIPLESLTNAGSLCARFLTTPYTSTSLAQGSNPWADITRDDWLHEFALIEALFKAATVVARLGADDNEREALRDTTTDWGAFDPTILIGGPLEQRGGSHSEAFERLLRAIDLFAQRRLLPGTSPTFAELLLDPSTTNIAARTGWDLATLEGFAPGGVNGYPDLRALLSWMTHHRNTGASVDALVSWTLPGSLDEFTNDASRTVVSAARSRSTTPQAWASVARPIRDRLRKAQRDALVAYLIAESEGQIDDADALYEHLLIDVSMNPEMLTSRVVQAACTVQLFVHRCLFGLEPAETCRCFNDEDREEWEWMRTYRVWEAARKVLLYPENWIEPELRDDKSSFFENLEKDLAQGDLSEDRVGTLTVEYLDRLAGVANLEVLAYYVERESDVEGTIDHLHVFARTRGEPASYWYRRRDDSATWTPWEKVEVGIEGKHLIPVVYERRLLLFWAEFTEVQSDDSQNADPTPARWWEIRLAMSERQDDRWSPKTLFLEALSTREKAYLHYPEGSYAFVSFQSSGALGVTCLVNKRFLFGGTCFFVELGGFEIDALAGSLVARQTEGIVRVSRLALGQTEWSAPGYLTTGSGAEGSLSIYRGAADDDGYPVETATMIDLLAECSDAVVVLPSQWDDFVSQSPFFVTQAQSVWFVEPSSTDDLLVDASLPGETPSLSGLALHREGTGPSGAHTQDIDEVLSEEEAEELSGSMGPSTDLTRYDSVCRLREAGMALHDELYEPDQSLLPGRYRFSHFYHPYVAAFRKEVRRKGIFGLLSPSPSGLAGEFFRQRATGEAGAFQTTYAPSYHVETPLPQDEIDFSESGAYSCYNWELFFHLPFLVARRLADQGRYEEAIRYFHAIFDPRTRTTTTDIGDPDPTSVAQWWRLKPFLEPVSAPITSWLAFTGADGDEAARDAFERQVDAWREDPFNPHLLARLRPGVYQRAIVMAYLDTLLAWGDHLFDRDTLESLNEATQLYVYARQVLGDRPALFQKSEAPETALCYETLSDSLDAAGNALVAIENASFPPRGFGVMSHVSAVALRGLQNVVYFNVPYNAKLLSYWDTIDDRLFKIRNGMNLEGVVRSLPLFSPPIDPSLLVRAAAAGLDIGSILDDLAGTPGPYRFTVMHGRAQALAGTVRGLGQALLSALEKRDGEGLALLRQEHEAALLDAVKEVRTRQVDEALASLHAARRSRKLAVARRDYYGRLIDEGLIAQEQAALTAMVVGENYRGLAATVSAIGSVVSKIPQVMTGLAAAVGSGGLHLGAAVKATSAKAEILADYARDSVGSLSTWATYKRRSQEWKHQKKQAVKEIEQIDKQIEAAQIRLEIAERELTNHELQVRHSTEVREWMESKYTNQELYDWMVGQLCALHFQAWQLACSVAKKAERCFNFELGYSDSSSLSFVRSDNWDASRRGLLAGERLALDLDRMDAAWLDRDVREHEMTKHVSLSLLDPLAVERLKVDGECYFEIPEAAFDLDCPSHYLRRIQSVALSIACVAGPQSNVNARLTLHGSSVRRTAGSSTLDTESCTNPSIVTSVATQDSGLFQADLKDPRYLPFERLGAISRWHLELTAREIPQLDWSTIEDVTLHLRYTARDGRSVGATALETLKVGVDSTFGDADGYGFVRLVSLKRDFPDELALAQDDHDDSVNITVGPELLYPADAGELSMTLSKVIAVVSVLEGHAVPTEINGDSLSGSNYVVLSPAPTFSGEETFSLTNAVFSDLDDLVLILLYT